MRNAMHKRYLYAVGLFFLASIVALGSWNTFSDLFNGPQVQYKHVLAGLALLLILRWCFLPGRVHGKC